MRNARTVLFTGLRVAIAAGLLLWLGTSGAIRWSSIGGLVSAWPFTLAALSFLWLGVVIGAWRLYVLMRPCGLHLPLAVSIRLTFLGVFFGFYLPGGTGSDVARIYYATVRNPERRTQMATIILLDRVVGMFTMMCWPLFVAPLFTTLLLQIPVLRTLLYIAGTICGGLVIAMLLGSSRVLRHSSLFQWILRKAPLGHHLEAVVDTVHEYRKHPGSLFSSVAISLASHTLAFGAALMIARAINPAGFSWKAALLIPLGFLANQVPVTPGGIGVGEAAFNQLFSLAGLTGGAEILISWRLLMFVIGLQGFLYYIQGRNVFVHKPAAVQYAKKVGV